MLLGLMVRLSTLLCLFLALKRTSHPFHFHHSPSSSSPTLNPLTPTPLSPSVQPKITNLPTTPLTSTPHGQTELAHLLSLPPPMYRLSPASSAAPNLLSGAAYFSGVDAAYHPLLSKPVGEVRNLFGKKNGKEECARGVWEVLREVARERGVEIEAE